MLWMFCLCAPSISVFVSLCNPLHMYCVCLCLFSDWMSACVLYVHVCVFTLTAKLSLLIGHTGFCVHTLVPSQHVERTELLKCKWKLKPFKQMWAGLVPLMSYSTSMCLYHPFDILYWCVFVCAFWGGFTHKRRIKIRVFLQYIAF